VPVRIRGPALNLAMRAKTQACPVPVAQHNEPRRLKGDLQYR